MQGRIGEPPKSGMDEGYYKRLMDQYVQEHGDMQPAAEGVIRTAAVLEQLKADAQADIASRGLREVYRNGNQRVERDNKSFAQFLKAADQQSKLLQRLRLLPTGRGTKAAEDEEDGDEEDELNNY